ncbi:MAG: nucleoside hydrolase [Streptosporangiales bacterium]
MTKVLLDVDTGTDDAVAIMLAALDPKLDLVAVTTVAGNAPVEYCTNNTLRVLDHIGADVPVYRGAARPLTGTVRRPRPDAGVEAMHGLQLDLPETSSAPQDSTAVKCLIDTYLGADGPDTVLVPTGPLTNIAHAIAIEPRIVERIPKIVIMGGAHAVGNVTPSAEFNVWADPEAAHAVLASGVADITLVPLDCTHQALVTADDLSRLDALGTPAATAAGKFIARRIRAHDDTQPLAVPHAAPVHDAVCVTSLVSPDVLEDTGRYHVDVELTGELTRGRTVVDTGRRGGQQPNATVALGGNAGIFVELLIETLGRTTG